MLGFLGSQLFFAHLGRAGSICCCKASSSAPNSRFLDKFVKNFTDEPKKSTKISVIGAGKVGIACCAFLLSQRLTSHLVMMDVRQDWVQAEALDFLHASSLISSPKIETCSDGNHTAGSKYIIVTAGVRPSGKSRLQIAQESLDILKTIVPNLVERSPKATFIICTNPADVMTWAIQQFSGLPKQKCISSGCHLDSLRFRYLIAKRLGVSVTEVNAYIVGEHGNSSVPIWSGVNVGGISLLRILPDIGTDKDKENWKQVHSEVITSGRKVSKVKGNTCWGIGLAVTDIIKAMIENSGRILSVGTDVQGLMGINDSVVMSMPCVLDSTGIRQVIELPLTKFEMGLLKNCADVLLRAQCSLNL